MLSTKGFEEWRLGDEKQRENNREDSGGDRAGEITPSP
jgi:hypothetical protein